MTLLAEYSESPALVTSQEGTRAVRPRWARPALAVLLVATAVLYLWGLEAAGWANEYYAAAVQAGTQSWKALLFGSLDAGNAITVDKPPASLWVMALSGRIFGFSTLSMLVPQALMGVGAVALVYGAVRRVSGYGAGLLAGAVLALTPVAALMFRFNNPDALLVLLIVVAGYCMIRALDGKSTRWIALAGVAIGFAFLAKLLQALLVTPAFALVVLVAVGGTVWQRLRDLAVGLIAMVVSAGWYLALVSWWPSDSRPYIGGSTNNSLLQLALGYNGLGRVFGGDGNPGGSSGPPDGPGPMGGSPMFGGSTGITRMFGESMGTEISWLLPAALIGLIAGLWFTRRAPRTDRTRASLLLWGGWLVVTVVVFSFMKGIMHPYYTVALAPAIAAVLGIGMRELWRGRQFAVSRVVLASMLMATGVWNFILLDRTPEWLPWLRWVVLGGAVVVAAVLLAGGHRLGRWTVTVAAAGLLVGLASTAAYTVETISVNHGGGVPTSGPSRSGAGVGGPGGPGEQQAPDNAELKGLLTQADDRWAAATVGSHTAGSLELSTGTSIMSIGGFNGGDDSPTLEQFQAYVAEGWVHYFIVGNGPGGGHRGGPDGDSNAGGQITQWVQQHFTAQDVGGTEVYDLTSPN
ncbi:glycosyltransferase family 39 protein [Mycobacterium sp. CVI_P3]|uniref:Glycosyltransferase family 39 protein n=1 Tax=Mycobacterium pinniadriaticum TaxID=2994102 RepID=A0ABT3SHQ9_9MYCO|nr:glycosyltransferase family 39 protein [Mycobacterium pinniadriaticum]MCX2932001.1 glycosyltransferase family 39 protein [Mycobacterium pinniadriaticum]MCX2938425.1 glycosyltransferase family 39 protein [Mycobacterium pinniadriaticum]